MDHCIQPLVLGSYPFGDFYDFIRSEEDVFPYGWDVISTISDEMLIQNNDLELLFVRHFAEYDELWFTQPTETDNRLISFRTDTNQWLLGPNIPTRKIFLDSEENIWMLDNDYDYYQPKIYRLIQNSFIEVPLNDENNQPFKGILNDLEVDRKGNFWFILEEGGETSLYSLSPDNMIATLQLTGEFFYGHSGVGASSIVFDENNILYVMRSRNTLMRFDPVTKEISETDLTKDADSYGFPSLFVDSKNRLWISDRMWFDLSQNDIRHMNIIIQSPVFIDFIEYAPRFSRVKPAIFLDSKDGRLWSTSRRGQAWFDLDSGEWCLFSSFERIIVKDSHGNLWTLINDTLYRLDQ